MFFYISPSDVSASCACLLGKPHTALLSQPDMHMIE